MADTQTSKNGNNRVIDASDTAKDVQLPIVISKKTTLSKTTDDVHMEIIHAIQQHMSDHKGILEKAEQITRDVEAEIRITDTIQRVEEGDVRTISYIREVRISKDGKR